jgi:hypothetical protein
MNINDLFNDRKTIGGNVLKLLKNNGFTKSSFSKRIDVTRPTLDSIIQGEINNVSKFSEYISRIINALEISENNLLYDVPSIKDTRPSFLYFNNPPDGHKVMENTKEIFGVLDDVLNLCSIYYKR